MKRRYQLLLIILVGIIITIVIHTNAKEDKLNLVALGDSFALGYIDKTRIGISFNDYLKDSLDIFDYNNEFCNRNLSISTLNNMLDKNSIGKKTNLPIKQVVSKADILTLAIGIDEIYYYTIFSNIDIDNYLKEYNQLIKNIRNFYNKKIIVIGLYPFNGIDKNTIIDLNNGIKSIAMEYNLKYIDIFAYALNKEYFYNNETIYLNYKAHKKIAKTIIKQNNS